MGKLFLETLLFQCLRLRSDAYWQLRRGKDLARMTRILESIRFNPKEFRRLVCVCISVAIFCVAAH